MICALASAFFRSFFLQTLWNFERMQNAGFAFASLPLLRRAARSREAFHAMLRRHTAFFNTHPYFAPIVMGVVYQREASRTAEEQLTEDATLTVLKDSMGGAFGAIGDHVLWGTWRPFAVVLALAVGILVAYPVTRMGGAETLFNAPAAKICAQWWIAGFLAAFNVIHLWIRWRGLQRACSEGPLVVKWVQSLALQAWAANVRRVALLLIGAMVLFYFSRWTSSDLLIWMVAVLLGTMIMKRWALSGTVIFYVVCGVSIAMTYLGIHWP